MHEPIDWSHLGPAYPARADAVFVDLLLVVDVDVDLDRDGNVDMSGER